MYFYITNSLGTYGFNTISPSMFFDKKKPYLAKKKYQSWVKVGIAKNISERFENYKTINPEIACSHQIKCRKEIALNLEDAFKRYLDEKRIYGSECYNLTPKEAQKFIPDIPKYFDANFLSFLPKSLPHSKLSFISFKIPNAAS